MTAEPGPTAPGPLANAATLFVDAPVAEGFANRPALVGPTGAISYAALRRLTDRAGHALRALGVEPEQRIALLLPDGPAWARAVRVEAG